MNVGSKYVFYIPYDLAYGAQGNPGGNIDPFSTLVFEVELLEILK
jgi:FKBP-type peptidyl-prolyl cis-trans isomerase FklB